MFKTKIKKTSSKYNIGDLLLTYKTEKEIPIIGMIVEKLKIVYRVEWYSAEYGGIILCGEGMIKLYREAYKEYRTEYINV